MTTHGAPTANQISGNKSMKGRSSMRASGFVGLIALVIGSAVGVTTVFGASNPSGRKDIGAAAKPSARVLEKFDANRNGTLDVAERETLKKDIVQRLQRLQGRSTEGYDKNGNGVLESAERQVLNQERKAQRARIHARALAIHDVNKNGVLDPSERQTMRERRKVFLQKTRTQALTRFDKNKNGTLDASERAEIQKVAAASKARALQAYDTNHDGRVDELERPGLSAASAAPAALAIAPTDEARLSSLRVLPVGGKNAGQGFNVDFALGRPTSVTIRIFDVKGRLVRTLASREAMRQGSNTIRWDARSQQGSPVSNGVYWIRVEAFGTKATQKVAVVR
jgi:Ca2+-binding EF-hand superfamily protein